MKKNVASQTVAVQMVTAASGVAFALTASAFVTIDGATQTAAGGTGPILEGNGHYSYTPTQAETNGDHLAFTFTGTGAIPVTIQTWTTFPQTVDNNVLAAGATGFAAIDTVVDAIKVKTDFLPSVTAGGNGGVFIAGTNAATTITTALTANITGNLSGSAGSVTGAVGSVTGAVGSVTGAVGSVTGAVGSVTGAVGSVAGNVDGNVSGQVESFGATAVAQINTEVDNALDTAIPGTPTAGSVNDVLADLDAQLPASTISTVTTAEVNTEVLDVMVTDTFAEPSSVPAATSSLKDKIGFIFTSIRNKRTQTATTQVLRNDGDAADICTTAVSDDTTTFIKGKATTP